MPNDSQLPAEMPDRSPTAEALGVGGHREARAAYAKVTLPPGWDATVDPADFFARHEEVRHFLGAPVLERPNWRHLPAHVLVVLAFCALVAFGRWRLIEALRPPPTPQEVIMAEAVMPLPVAQVPPGFKEKTKALNRAIEAERWERVSSLLDQMLADPALRAATPLREALLIKALKAYALRLEQTAETTASGETAVLVRVEAYYRELEALLASLERIPPFSAAYAYLLAQYAALPGSSTGGDIGVEPATRLLHNIDRLRGNYGPEMDRKRHALLIEANTLLSSFGESFDPKKKHLHDRWDRLVRVLAKLEEVDRGHARRDRLHLRLRMWTLVDEAFSIPLWSESVQFGSHTYAEEDVRARLQALRRRLDGGEGNP